MEADNIYKHEEYDNFEDMHTVKAHSRKNVKNHSASIVMSVLPSALLSLSPFGGIPLILESQYQYALQTPEEEVGLS
jgi:hypothetical protein